MMTVTTQQGKRIEIISQFDLRAPFTRGGYVRAYCHIHGSDHQRSLSINRSNGWGHCFNAACQATVLVAEWNPQSAAHLTHRSLRTVPSTTTPLHTPPEKTLPLARQPVLLHLPRETAAWQQEELSQLLSLDRHMHRSLTHAPRARAYLHARGISLHTAITAGIRYLSPETSTLLDEHARKSIHRWADRILFPLVSPLGKGYIGRSLSHWQPGMDENQHKALLERTHGPRRWIKTNPAGWFSCDLDHLSERIVLVEGGFDRLTLLTAGFGATDVVALVGTAAPVDWFPPQVTSVVLALDADRGGNEATERLAEQLLQEGFSVSTCTLPQDKWGKDWNERWRKIGPESINAIVEAYRALPSRARSA